MPKVIKASLDEIISRRRMSTTDEGTVYKAIVVPEMETKGYDPDKRTQKFVMSSERTDWYGDIVRQDGIDIDAFTGNPVGLAFHRHTSPIGWWKDVVKINGRPKRTEGTLELHAPGTTDAVDEIDRLLAAKAIKACSIGFMPGEAEWIVDEEGRNTWGLDFKTSSLIECSVCSVPANPDALAKAAGGDMRLAAEMFERFLDTYCEKTSGGIVVRKDFADAYIAMKTPKTTVVVPSADDIDEVTEREISEAIDLDLATLSVTLDTTDAEQKLTGLSKMFDNVIQKARDLAGLTKNEPPAPEYVPEALDKAKALRERMKQLADKEAA